MTAPKLPDLYTDIDLMRDVYMTGAQREAYERILARAAVEASQPDPWRPSRLDYDRSIHHNPDAAAWADFFVATFPAQAGQRDLMLGWFANAMMAMHDHIHAQPKAEAVTEVNWRALYRFQTAMRYMDNNAKLTREMAYAMADRDVSALSQGGKP